MKPPRRIQGRCDSTCPLLAETVVGDRPDSTGQNLPSFTLAHLITLLARGRASRAECHAVLGVVSNAGERQHRVGENFDTYTKHLKLTKALLIGGVSVRRSRTS